MDIAAIILALVSLFVSLACLVWLLVKHFSTHTIQYVDPLSGLSTSKGGLKDPFEAYKEIGEMPATKTPPIGDDI